MSTTMGQADEQPYFRSVRIAAAVPVGIVGAGHLGRALAQLLLQHGLLPEDLMISFQGSPATAESLRAMGLLACRRGNDVLAREARTLLLTIGPHAVEALAELRPRADLVISCMAGVPAARLERVLHCRVTRVMPSGPETIAQGRGIATVFPSNPQARTLLLDLGLKVFDLADEELLHWFTVGVCLPAALLAAPADADIDAAAKTLGTQLPWFGEVFAWARGVTPRPASVAEREHYIQAMATPGGVTEAIVTSLRSGSTFLKALNRGHERSQVLARGR